jgi:hypothetical protein
MSKRNNRKNQSPTKPKSTTPTPHSKTAIEDPAELKPEIAMKHEENISPEDQLNLKDQPESPELSKALDSEDLIEAWSKLEELWKKAEQLIQENEAGKKAGEILHQELEVKRAEYKEIEERRAWLAREEEQLQQQKVKLEAGFTEKIQAEKDELKRAQAECKLDREKLLQDRQAMATQLKKRRDELEEQFGQELEKREKALSQIEQTLVKKSKDLDRKEKAIAADEEILEEDREALRKRRERLTDERVEKLKADLSTERKTKKELQDLLEERGTRIAELETQFHQLGHQSPAKILRELEELRTENTRLEDELANSLSAQEAARLQQLEQDIQAVSEARNQALQDKLKAESALQKVQTGVTELADLRDQVEKQKSRLSLKQDQLNDLQATIDDYTQKSEGKETFHFCTGMDEKPELQQDRKDFGSFENLKKLTEYLRHRIAKVEGVPLYYSERTIRTFLAGLAIGKLSLLEGISGTGKTSLPRAFAKAIGGDYQPVEIIEVQSGWRDRQDLLGFFNTFENKYHESPFLNALYRAGTPQMKDTPFFIILDEMNLSHPEHYFADLLSQIENNEDARKIRLDAGGKTFPKQFEQTAQGLFLPLPPNVWFIGTANQDETTLQFAPKTYDRANVMEMPIHPETFTPKKQNKQFLSYSGLSELFQKAQEDQQAANEAKSFLADTFRDLVTPFGLGWGNRLEKQLSKFVPVYQAAGGPAHEAVDHLIASKILRNLRNRFDLQQEQLATFREAFSSAFDEKYKGNQATHSLAIIDKELQRLGA